MQTGEMMVTSSTAALREVAAELLVVPVLEQETAPPSHRGRCPIGS